MSLYLRLLSVASSAAILTLAVGCGGASSGNSDLEVNDVGSTSAGLAASPNPAESGSDTTGDDEASTGHEVGDKDCSEGDRGGHGKHHRHKFSALDSLDGSKDGKITIASLPAGLPERLLAKLAALDTDHDGVVTKAEVKAFRKHHKHGDRFEHEGADEQEPAGSESH